MIEYKNGIHLKGTGLWFDSKKKTELSFLSSADIEKFTPPEKVIATPETIKILEKKIRKSLLLSCPYNRPFTLGDLQVELIPSGHMLGSAQMVIDKGDKTFIYAGDINLRDLPTAEHVAIKHCDVLVLKCKSGLTDAIGPKFEASMKLVTKFIEDCFSSNLIPLLQVNAIGVGQDIIMTLGKKGFKLSLHESTHTVTKIYEDLGITFGEYGILKSDELEQRVIIIPPEEVDSKLIKSINNKQSAIIIENEDEQLSSEKIRDKTDTVFKFTTVTNYNELLKYVEKVKPNKVYLIDEFANEFAKTLESKGYEAIVLEKPTQLNLL